MKALGKIRRSEARRKAAAKRWDSRPQQTLTKPTQARGAWSYRGARVNTDRGRRASEILKQTRLRVGVTRRQLDRARHEQRVSL